MHRYAHIYRCMAGHYVQMDWWHVSEQSQPAGWSFRRSFGRPAFNYYCLKRFLFLRALISMQCGLLNNVTAYCQYTVLRRWMNFKPMTPIYFELCSNTASAKDSKAIFLRFLSHYLPFFFTTTSSSV